MRLWVLLFCLVSAGCTVLEERIEQGADFPQRVVLADLQGQETVNLYIAGDGRPFLSDGSLASDPTVGFPLALELMRRDDGARFFLGRPCYHGTASSGSCHARYWTSHRYSEAVVVSMVAAARGVLKGRPVRLIGHSGGGVLAVLMAQRLERVVGIITLAANLDLQAWTTHHGYTPLSGSVSPLDVLPELQHIPQMHVWGGQDEVVPASIGRGLEAVLPRGSICVIPRYDHSCCWRTRWRHMLASLIEGRCKAP